MWDPIPSFPSMTLFSLHARVRRMPLRLLILVALLLPSAAAAETVCIAREAGFAPKAPEAERPAPVGTLARRACYPVVERFTDRTRIWVRGASGFQGEVEVKNDDLLQVLLDDVDLKDEADGAVWGQILSGAGVAIEGQAGGEMLRVSLVEGRFDFDFVVSADDIYYGESWPQPDPDDAADGGWPEGTLPLPPTTTELRSLDGRRTRVKIGPPPFHVDDLLLDPTGGQLRFAREEGENESVVTVVAPTIWVSGTTSTVDWREDPVGGWAPDKGKPQPKVEATAPRQVGDNAARIASEAKGDAFGELLPGTRVTVLAEEKGWMQVTAPWSGGRVQGWIEKKRLLKEGKEPAVTPAVTPVASVSVGNTVVRWADDTGHVATEETPEDFEPHDLVLTIEPVTRALFHHNDELRLAWGTLLKTAPTAAGEATLRLLVSPEGEILEAGLPKATLAAEALNQSLLEWANAAEFEERKVPRKRRRSDPDLDWNVEVWVQLLFAGS